MVGCWRERGRAVRGFERRAELAAGEGELVEVRRLGLDGGEESAVCGGRRVAGGRERAYAGLIALSR